jgi:hypothetical protein
MLLKDQIISRQNMPLGFRDYLKLTVLRNREHRKKCKNWVKKIFRKKTLYIYKGVMSLKVVLCHTRRMSPRKDSY